MDGPRWPQALPRTDQRREGEKGPTTEMTNAEQIASEIVRKWNGSDFAEFFFSAKRLKALIAEAIECDRKERKEFMSETARETAEKIAVDYAGNNGLHTYPHDLATAITAALEERDREVERLEVECDHWKDEAANNSRSAEQAYAARNTAEATEQARWQSSIYELLLEHASDDVVDGKGCDSGDPLDFTLTEIGQALNHVADERDSLKDLLREAVDQMRFADDAMGGYAPLHEFLSRPEIIALTTETKEAK